MEEVLLWRGTSEQRALRQSSRKPGRFRYFDEQLDHPAWTRKKKFNLSVTEAEISI